MGRPADKYEADLDQAEEVLMEALDRMGKILHMADLPMPDKMRTVLMFRAIIQGALVKNRRDGGTPTEALPWIVEAMGGAVATIIEQPPDTVNFHTVARDIGAAFARGVKDLFDARRNHKL